MSNDTDNIADLAEARTKRTAGENALANAFAAQYTDELRFVAKWAQWYSYDKGHWSEDTTLHTYDRIRRFCEGSKKKPNAKTVGGIERLAKSDRRFAATHDQWDTDPWLLNTPSGVIELRAGRLRPARPDDYMTKITTVGPDRACAIPVWTSFLERITAGSTELVAFLQRFFGYSLTGITREQALGFGYGSGANGKSVLTAAIAGIMGEYHTTAPLDTFTASLQEHHPTDLAGMRGARLVTVTEIEEGRRWAESKIKAMTGGDEIAARFMRQDFFRYTPQFKLWIAGNHKPRLRNVNEATRRRLSLVPFAVTIPVAERDRELGEKLKAEWPGILNWLIEGCLAWQRDGLNAPNLIKDATSEYFTDEDTLGLWLAERIEKQPFEADDEKRNFILSKTLYRDWKDWIEASGEEPGSQRHFTEALQSKGYRFVRRRNGRGFVGIQFRSSADTAEAAE